MLCNLRFILQAPGQYYKPKEPENKGFYFNFAQRFELEDDSNAPGPGTYTVSHRLRVLFVG